MTQPKLRIGLLSCAHLHALSYSEAIADHTDVDFVGIWNEDAAAGQQLADERGIRYFQDLNALLEKKLDGVVIASENINHLHLTRSAANADVKAILCEKPLATTLADAQAMIDACDATGAKLLTAFPCRFSPVFQRLKATIDGGKIGKLLAIRATNHGSCPFGWFVEQEKSGGGAIIDHTVHVADLNRILMGAEAVEVYAESGNNMYHQDWEDCGMLTVTYSNGAFVTLDTSWSRPRKSFPTWGDVNMEVVGTDGVASMEMFGQEMALHSEQTGNTKYLGWGSNIDAGMIDEFLTVASGGESSLIASGVDGLKALQVALAAYESARTHLPVKL